MLCTPAQLRRTHFVSVDMIGRVRVNKRGKACYVVRFAVFGQTRRTPITGRETPLRVAAVLGAN